MQDKINRKNKIDEFLKRKKANEQWLLSEEEVKLLVFLAEQQRKTAETISILDDDEFGSDV